MKPGFIFDILIICYFDILIRIHGQPLLFMDRRPLPNASGPSIGGQFLHRISAADHMIQKEPDPAAGAVYDHAGRIV